MSGDSEKPYDPTPSKLEKAREKGEVARSTELNTLAAYIGCLAMITMVFPIVAYRVIDAGGDIISRANSIDMASAGALALWEITIGATALIVAPMTLVTIAILAQRSAVFSPSRLLPKASRISILSGIKNKFGTSGLFEFLKSALKMCVYTALLTTFLRVSVDMLTASAMLPVGQSYLLLSRTIAVAVILVIGIGAVLALVDVAWQRHSHHSKNKMSRQELQDELKESDGDPHFKAKRQQRGRELASNRMLDDVPRAAVIVVNPTHYAVALQWSSADPTPPVCLAKGKDELAARIREVGMDAGVPIFSDPPTTRALFATVDIGASISREHFKAVAAAIRFSEELKRGRSDR